MSGDMKIRMNNTDGSSLITSDNFLNLKPGMQHKVIDTILVAKEKDGGYIGKLIGIHPLNAALNVAYTVIILLLLFLLIDMVHSYLVCRRIDMELVKVIIPAITLSMGYIFGKGNYM